MKPVTMYGNAMCPYCGAARMLLTKKGIKFTEPYRKILLAIHPLVVSMNSMRSTKMASWIKYSPPESAALD